MNIDLKFKFKDIVYLKTDQECLPRIITGVNIRPCGVAYCVAHNTNETSHYEFELTSDVKEVIKVL